MKANDVTLLTCERYFRDFAAEVAKTKAGDRVALATMSLRPDQPLIGAMVDALEAAAKRGVRVYLTIDAYNFLKGGQAQPGPLWPRTTLPKNLRQPYIERIAALERVTEAGGHCGISNMPSRPFSPIHGGRSHIKAAVINNTVYAGGCNLNDASRLDVMGKWRDQKTADWVYEMVRTIVEKKGTMQAFDGTDRQFKLDSSAAILVDAGKQNQSTILQNAFQMIDEAREHIFITCQYFPGGSTARHLKAAHDRGVKVDIRYSHPTAHGLEAPAHYLYNMREQARMPAEFFTGRLGKSRPLLHAKVLCTEKSAMLGSHNYVTHGVAWGTAEIALRVNSPEFSNKLRTFMLKQIDI